MKDKILKLRILYIFVHDAFFAAIESWRRDIWDADPDDYCCCDGRYCGCGGETNREHWDDILDNLRELEKGG